MPTLRRLEGIKAGMQSVSHKKRRGLGHTICWVCAGIVALSPAVASSAQVVHHVDQRALGRSDGTSWADAFVDLQDALAVAQAGDEIWVAGGTYAPDCGTGDRAMAFTVPSGVRMYGGFSGVEQCREDRDWTASETILSGDLNGDDGPNDCAEFSDCCRKHDAPGCDNLECQTRVCDLYDLCCVPGSYWSMSSCVFIAERECSDLFGNWRRTDNSYIVVEVSDASTETLLDGLTIRGAFRTAVEGLTISGGYGMRAHRAGAVVRNTRFVENSSAGAWGWEANGISFVACKFHDNYSASLFMSGRVYLTDTDVYNNGQGAGVIRGPFFVTNCRFVSGERSYGVLLSASGDFVVSDSILVGNSGWAITHDGRALITGCTFDGNYGGLFLDGSGAHVRDSVFVRNTHSAMSLNGSNVRLSNSIVVGNGIQTGYGAIYSSEGALTIDNCSIVGNHAGGWQAGGVVTDWGSRVTVRNSIFWDNTATNGPNVVDGEAGSFYLYEDEIYPSSTLDINYSIVNGWTGTFGGAGNSGADPVFADLDGLDDVPGTLDDDLRLTPGSPAINAGAPYGGMPATDLDGVPRALCGWPDVGAYEFGIGDYDCNQIVDLSDFAAWANCATGPIVGPIAPGCEAFDAGADGDVDLHDFYLLEHVFVGP
ncbi:MAG: right-handed parallel beta-helix repeat-containing protein [Planctomycetota bacterium]